ncbi:Purple acid phosphatase 7 [Thelohanellus kitauei]|uniref:Purple acid phosphatase 7 n=1 Tax=Thelohanellus kitauei TaxID=669202 RepID=A0A0C2J5U6_THEKT|nr:Purple acid phosphatase 7 [Thelohanellus kitauei]
MFMLFKVFENYSDKTFSLDKEEINIVVIGDMGRSEHQSKIKHNVVESIKKINNESKYDLGILLGDNLYPDGFKKDDFSEIKEMFTDSFPKRDFDFDFITLLGNHEYRGDILTSIKYYRTQEPRFYQPGRFFMYTVNLSNTIIKFVCMDSTPLVDSGLISPYTMDDVIQKKVLEEMLLNTTSSTYTFLLVHHNVMKGCGPHNPISDSNILHGFTLLTNISAVINGHNHNMQLFPKGGDWNTNYLTVGNGAKISKITKNYSTDEQWCYDKSGGFGNLKITKTNALFEFIDEHGNVLRKVNILPKE